MGSLNRAVITTGVSILGAQNTLGAWIREQTPESGPGLDPRRPSLCEGADDGALLEALKAQHGLHAALPELLSEPKRVSAEFSALHALCRQGRFGKDGPKHVELIHTETADGRLAARLVAMCINRQWGAHVVPHAVADLDANHPERFRWALGAFMDQVVRTLEHGSAWETAFIPLGGYKVMTSLGMLAGAWSGYPSVYVHEVGQVGHEIPPIPLTLEVPDAPELGPLVRRLRGASGLAWSELAEREQAVLQANPWLFERTDVDGETFVDLGPFGHFLRRRPAWSAAMGMAVRLSADAQAPLEKARRHVREGIRQLMDKVEEDVARVGDPKVREGLLRHEKAFGLHTGNGVHLFKPASRGRAHGVFRAVYRHDRSTDTLDLLHIWTDHDLYEKEAKHVVSRLDEAPDSLDLTDLTRELLA